MGIDFPHEKGRFCPKVIRNYYTVCCFSTPFIYLLNGEYVQGNKGDIIIHTPGAVVHQGSVPEAETGFVNDWFHIEGNDFTELLEKYPVPLNRAFSVNQGYFFRKYAVCLMEEFNGGEKGSNDMIDSILTQMMVELHRAYEKTTTKLDGISQVIGIRKQIIANPEKNWTLCEMSQKSGYSISRFSELYLKLYGVSPIEDVLTQRINMAKRLLSLGQASVSYTAQNCGFSSINYFSKYFKKVTGLTPREYSKQFNE